MKYYLLFFSAIYAVVTIIFASLTTLLNISGGTGVAPLIAVGFLTAWQFVKRERRVPNPNEKKQLIWGSILSTFLISAVLVTIFVLTTMSVQSFINLIKFAPIWIWFIAFGIVILIEFFILQLSYGWYAKLCLKNLSNKKRLR